MNRFTTDVFPIYIFTKYIIYADTNLKILTAFTDICLTTIKALTFRGQILITIFADLSEIGS